MYPFDPPAVYAHESVVADPRYAERMSRVVSACDNAVEPVIYTDDDLPAMINDQGLLDRRVSMGTLAEIHDPILLFNTFRFDGRRDERYQWLADQGVKATGHTQAALLGYGPFSWANYNLPGDAARHDKICRPCWRIHFQNGCVHRCHYCGLGGLLATMVNVEDYVEQLGRLIEAHPWQETYLLEDDAEIPVLEPELGCLGPIIEFFGTLEDRYVVIHTKTWNVDWLLDLPHNGNTIIVWSLSAPTQSRVFEPVAGTTEERIEAARKCQEAGYTIRYKFKPIIPVRNWRQEATQTIDLLFEKTNPDVISLCTYMWMTVEEMTRRLDADYLDPEYLKAAEESVEEMADTRAKPFPEWVRAEIYEHHFDEIRKRDAEVPVSLSTENFPMWKRLGPKLGFTPTNYVCGCGPNSVPWRRKLERHAFEIAAAGPQGGFELI